VTAQDWQWNTKGRVIAVSDIHGAYDEFISLLKGTQLIDEAGHWHGETNHLVIVGDVLDRGAASRDVLALIMRLEKEAEQSGGKVHLVLGNHEIMNLVGDLRYVAVEEYARYVDEESPADREEEFQRFQKLEKNGDLPGGAMLAQFEQMHPPGFFGHSKLFSREGDFGKWLLKRPVIIKINESIFVHGGLSQAMQGKSANEINRLHHDMLLDYVAGREYFVNKGILGAATNFFEQPHLIKNTLEAGRAEKAISPEDLETTKSLFAAYRSEIFADDSPTWYRGNVGCSDAIEQDRLQVLLESLGAKRLVIGHSPTPSRSIESRFNGMLIKIDTGMLKSRYRGQASAIVISGDKIVPYYAEQPAKNSIITQSHGMGAMTDPDLEQALRMAPISKSYSGQDKFTRLTIDYEGTQIEALFIAAKSKKRGKVNLPGAAAYRLDRHLGIDMTPVTVQRNVNGDNGTVTLNLEKLIDDDQRLARQLGDAWCPLKDQFNMMYMFDTLVHNKGRKRTEMRYITNDMKLLLTDNEKTLGTQRSVPRYLKSAPVLIPVNLKKQLQALNESSLETLLGDVLDEKRRKAILSRRDLLLKTSN